MNEEDVKVRLVLDEEDPQEVSSGMIARPLHERIVAPKVSYEAEAIGLRIERLIEQHGMSKSRGGEADMLSRLLVDVHDGGVGLADAERIVTQMESRFANGNDSDAAKTKSQRVGAIVLVSLLICAVLVGLGGFMVATQKAINNVGSPMSGSTDTAGNAVLVSTPRSWQYYANQSDAPRIAQQSIDDKTSTKFKLFNSSSEPVQVYWISYEGKRVFYANVGAMKSFEQLTFASHPWEVQNANGKTLLYFAAGDKKNETIDLVGTMRSLKR